IEGNRPEVISVNRYQANRLQPGWCGKKPAIAKRNRDLHSLFAPVLACVSLQEALINFRWSNRAGFLELFYYLRIQRVGRHRRNQGGRETFRFYTASSKGLSDCLGIIVTDAIHKHSVGALLSERDPKTVTVADDELTHPIECVMKLFKDLDSILDAFV